MEGLDEDDQTDLFTLVAATLAKTGVQCTTADLDSVHRIGKQTHSGPRPIIIRFLNQSKRDAILFNRMNLNKNTPNEKPLWLNDEVSDITKRNRKTVRDVVDHAKSLGVEEIEIHGDGLVIGTIKIKHQDLDLLPPLFTVSCAKTIHSDQHIFFQSEVSPFSNFFPARFEDSNAIVFESTEQAFQYKKALFHDSNQIATKILTTRDPFEHKRLGNLITPVQQWRDTEANIMSELLMYKFTQSKSLADLLLSTGDKQLHEATTDPKWAIGSSLTAKATKEGTWTGGGIYWVSYWRVSETHSQGRALTPPQLSGPPPPPLPPPSPILRTMTSPPFPWTTTINPTPLKPENPLPLVFPLPPPLPAQVHNHNHNLNPNHYFNPTPNPNHPPHTPLTPPNSKPHPHTPALTSPLPPPSPHPNPHVLTTPTTRVSRLQSHNNPSHRDQSSLPHTQPQRATLNPNKQPPLSSAEVQEITTSIDHTVIDFPWHYDAENSIRRR